MSKLPALVLAVAAALVSGAVAFAQTPSTQPPCLEIRAGALTPALPGIDLVVVGTVAHLDSTAAVIAPEAFLKGPAQREDLLLRLPNAAKSSCEPASFTESERVMVFLQVTDGSPGWPSAGQAFVLKDGQAFGLKDTLTEVELIAKVRAATGQYAVPAASESEGAGIDWGQTVIPLAAALTVVMVIGLFLMRIWHRIDPS